MINYLIHTTSIWAVLYIAYRVLLSKEKYFELNRMYLMASLAIGLFLPLVQFFNFSTQQVMPEVSAIYHEQVNYISHISTSLNATNSEQYSINWTSILFVLISIGMAVMLLKNIVAGVRISALYQDSEKYHYQDFTEVRTRKEHLPFSFFRYIFFSAFKLSEQDRLAILNHEIHHVKAKHTWDILFVEGIKVFFWWNPLIYLYKKAITENHEFAADHSAMSLVSRKAYCTVLLQANMPGVNLDLGHPFFSTYIKKRIDMMYRKNSTKKSYLKFILPVIAIVFMAFIIKDNHLELEYTLDSDYIDLYADDELLIPNVDYVVNREKGKVIVMNRRDSDTKGVKYCMFIIDEPRNLFEFETAVQPDFTDFVPVHIQEDGTKTVGDKNMTTKEIMDFVRSLETQKNAKIKVKVSIAEHAKSKLIIEFLEEALSSDINVLLDDSQELNDHSIPSISPLAPKDVIKKNGFGNRVHPIHKREQFHKGLDLVAKIGAPVFATATGKVTAMKVGKGGYGRHIIIDHGNAYTTLYGHLNEFVINEGEVVEQGQHIGYVGASGVATGPHLHYEVRLEGKAVDPKNYGAIAFYESKDDASIENNRLEAEELEKPIERSNLPSKKDVENDAVNDKLIKLGFNVNRGVIVKAGKLKLVEGQDYELDYQLGYLKIINEDYLSNAQPITVEFTNNDSDQIKSINNVNALVAKTVESDMDYDRDCKVNKEGVYFFADKMPNLATCNSDNLEDDSNCTREELASFINEHKLYPEAMVKKGFQGMLIFNITIDENGNIESYNEVLRKKRGDNYPELVSEGNRLMELLKSNKKLLPAQCNGKNVKSLLHVSTTFVLDEEQMKRVERKDASNTLSPNQIATLTGMHKNGLGYSYDSNMNVPYTVKITDPMGDVIYNESFNYIYKSKRDIVEILNKVNGKYIIEVTQDGKTVSSSMNCTLF